MPSQSKLFSAVLIVSVFALSTTAIRVAAAESTQQAIEKRFVEIIHPFLNKYCLRCHGAEKQEGKLDLSGHSSAAAIVKNHRVWDLITERLEAEEMPPKDALQQPSTSERQAVVGWIQALREDEAQRNAGDPGIVLARRLSLAEFDYTVRDLTGVDIRPTREFPVDPANEAGFDNSGESLTMSPALLKKYLAATRLIADHLVLKPRGFVFAAEPAVTETDRDKYCVQRIVAFYQRHQVEYADYFLAAWRFQHRAELGRPNAELSDFALEAKLSPKYLQTIWSLLTESPTDAATKAAKEAPPDVDPLATVQAQWRSLPTTVQPLDAARRGCEALRDEVVRLRKSLVTKPDRLHVKGISDGSQPFVMWWNRQLAAQRMISVGGDLVPASAASRARFCRVFPDTFSVSARGAYFDPNLGAQARLLTAGFHLMQGYYRDDGPLYELVLDEAGQRELDSLWQELNFVTLAPVRQYKDFIFFERAEPPRFAGGAEFDFARSEDQDVTSNAKMTRMRDVYLEKAREIGADGQAVQAMETYFDTMSADIRWIERAHRDAESSHLDSLRVFAERAYRRPLSSAEQDELLAFYRRLREHDSLSHEDAIRDSVVGVLMSPHFCYRVDLGVPPGLAMHGKQASSVSIGDSKTIGLPVRPLSDYELASRLSYFLWSSMPDEELLATAAAGTLHKPEVLLKQVRRMLGDHRIRGLATEFAGNWLDFRRFEEHNSVDRERFASFTNELRAAMYEEPLRFFIDVASHNRSVLEFLDADHTFVNPLLAKHYGIAVPNAAEHEWVRVDGAQAFGRGGLLPMSVFLTKNAPGLRTSPVKRGYWVVRRLLGEHIPPPPPNVPELPKDEAAQGELTLPQLLARHRDHQACAGCHQRFDSIGLVFEGYGPIGERRDLDLGGRPIDAKAVFPDGSEGTGLEGLRTYLRARRQEEFVDNLTGKLLAYALGRSLLLSDKPTIRQIRAQLVSDGYRFESLVESIVTSSQFLNKRERDAN